MRRTRHKFLQISVFFLIYSIIHVLSENSTQIIEKNATETTENPTSIKFATEPPKTTSRIKLLTKSGNSSGISDCTPPAIQQVSHFFVLVKIQDSHTVS